MSHQLMQHNSADGHVVEELVLWSFCWHSCIVDHVWFRHSTYSPSRMIIKWLVIAINKLLKNNIPVICFCYEGHSSLAEFKIRIIIGHAVQEIGTCMADDPHQCHNHAALQK